ncbi:Hypothetical protein R9X50_00138700 [Acrodontium crateriforme]|uniref:Uncharacterized protein n=1 Tax=Acrodontium crateriforme TaxID=150365 RepID=A0AAQ3M0P0_9PEZI|nr:Hypothetical protein R9X50_00138700 [Acrodontium crateriforme]
MAFEAVSIAPTAADFTPLNEHQEQTPDTFFGGKPVLHLHCSDAKLRISKFDLSSQPHFAALQDSTSAGTEDEIVEISNVAVWVTSRYFTIFASASSKGVQISYQTISIHAQDGDAVLLELNLSDPNASDDEMMFLQLRIVPGEIEQQAANGDHANGSAANPAAVLYNAISACQELNPDPPSDDEGEGFDETAPGATGWITSENMHDFVDEDGNFKMPDSVTMIGGEEETGGLGEGAGRTRTAAEADGDDGPEDDTKWQRTA